MFHSKYSIQCSHQPTLASIVSRSLTNSGIVVTDCDDGVEFIVALSSSEVFAQSFPAFTCIYM